MIGFRSKPHQKYIERDDAAEKVEIAKEVADVADPAQVDIVQDTIVSSFGNISNDPAERDRFWQLVDENEENPRPPKVTLDPTVNPALFAEVERLALQAGEDYPALRTAIATNGSVTEIMQPNAALALVRLFQKAGHQPIEGTQQREGQLAPIVFKLSNGGRTQTRLVIELPHEMTPMQRLELAREFASRYEKDGLKYWAVIHAPNKHNDDRNYHLHINLYDRPCDQIFHEPSGRMRWDFEREWKGYKGTRTKKFVRIVDRQKHDAYRTLKWVRTERARFALISNDHLKNAGLPKRLDPRRYEDMGVQDKARTRISPAAYARERKGEITAVGVAFAKDQWDNNRVSVELIAKSDKSYEAWRRAWLLQEIRPQLGRGTPEAVVTVIAASKIGKLSAEKTKLVTARNALNHVAAKLESRARLKPESKRDDADRAALAVAGEMKADISKADRKIGLALMQIAKAEKAYITAKQRDDLAIGLEGKRLRVARMRAISRAALLEVDGPDISDMSRQPTAVALPESAKEAEPVMAPIAVADEGMPVTIHPDDMVELPDPDEEHRQRRAQRLMEAIRRRVEEERAERVRIAASLPQETPLPKPPPASIKPEAINNDDREGTPIAANPRLPKRSSAPAAATSLDADQNSLPQPKPVAPEELEKEGLSREAIAKYKAIQERIRQSKSRSR